jgi:ferrous iron transport protein B
MLYMSTGELIETNNLIELKEVLIANGWTIKTALCMIIFSLMHWPCSTTCLTIYKETKSTRWTIVAIILPTICGVLMCMSLNLFFVH